jgi:hypothetical protein
MEMIVMSQIYMNCFKISNLHNISYEYDIYKVSGVNPMVEDYEKYLSNLSISIGSQIKNVVVLTKISDQDCLAVPTESELLQNTFNIGMHQFRLEKENKQFKVEYNQIKPDQITLAKEFLLGAFRNSFIKNNLTLWSDNSRSYFPKRPLNSNDKFRRTDIYRGFSYDIIVTEKEEFAIQIDPIHRYISRYYLDDLINEGIEFNPSVTNPLHCLYEMAHRWFPINVTSILIDKSIGEQMIPDKGMEKDLYTYTLNSANKDVLEYYKNKLKKTDKCIIYQYPYKKGTSLYAAISLARLKYKTDNPDVKRDHQYATILGPTKRIEIASSFVEKYFGQAMLGNVSILPSQIPLEIKAKIFPVPDILSGQNKILHIRQGNEEGVNIEDLGKTRLKNIMQYGVIDQNSPLLETHLLVPDTISSNSELIRNFKENVENLIKRITKQDFSLKYTEYKVNTSHTLREQFHAIDEVIRSNNLNSGVIVIILPRNAKKHLHHQIKREYYKNFQLQCVDENTLSSYFIQTVNENGHRISELNSNKGRSYQSYINCIVLGILQVHRRWPSCLKSPLNYDAYIGVDVLNGFVGFTFIYKNAKICYFKPEPLPTSQRGFKERINGKLFHDIIYNQLTNDIKLYGLNIRSVVLHRDGICFKTEKAAFRAALKKVFNKEIQYGIVEIHKTSTVKIRLLRKNNENTYSNPKLGTYYIFGNGKNDAIISTTGYPFDKHQDNRGGYEGTSSPLHVRVVAGNCNFEKIVQDVFNLSVLCWSAPAKSSRLPITIKLSDDFLEPIASRIDEIEDFNEEEYELSNKNDLEVYI